MHTTSMLLVASATVLALVAGRTSAATSTSTLSSTRAHAAVFEPLLTSLNADCHTITAENACLAAHCAWCKAGAVPSACYTADEAAQLPPAVFQCDTQQQQQQQLDDNNNNEQQEINWELTTAPATDEHVTSLFRAWQQQFDKRYVSAHETATRRAIFAANARDVAVHNAQRRKTFTMALNAFADLTWDEFQASYLLTTPQKCSATSTTTLQATTTPDTKDWRNDGAVSPVKNQGKCGSCWTFSTTGCLESHWQLAHHEMILLSEQQLLDCAGPFDNHGCNGGLPSHAFEYIHYAGGLNTAATYPYVAAVGKCKFNAYHIGATVAQVVNITARDEQHLHVAVGTIGPVSIAFQVVSDFRFYKSGVYSSTDCKAGEQDVNHAVLAVGYGTRDEHTQQRAGAISQEDDVASSSNTTPYWIVKNSWGNAWGMDGFFEIARGTNMCGVATCASYPVVG